MKIVVMYKWAPDPQYARVNAAGVVDWGSKRSISEYDPVAIRVGRILADATGAELIGVTAGDESAASAKATQAAASRGLDELLVVADDALAHTPSADVYARALAQAISTLDDVVLILAGDSSADVGGRAVPNLVAGYLQVPALSQVQSVEAQDGDFVVSRDDHHMVQQIAVRSTAVLSITTDATSVPLIGMKEMVAARKKPVHKLSLAELPALDGVATTGKVEVTATAKPEVRERKNIVFDSDQAAQELVAALREEGVL